MESILYFIFLISPKYAFKLEHKILLNLIKQQPDSLAKFPLIVWLTFNKETIYQKFLKGKSIRRQIQFKMRNDIRKMDRNPTPEVAQRYAKFCLYIRRKKQKEEFIKEIDRHIAMFPEFEKQQTT